MTDDAPIALPGLALPIAIRRDRRARRVTLRIDNQARAAIALAPPGTPRRRIERFCRDQHAWIAARLARLNPPIALAPGDRVPVFGIEHAIVHVGPRGRPMELAEREIRAAGPLDHVPRRVVDGLRRHARDWLTERAEHYAGRLEAGPISVSVRQARTRWGSCAPGGRISFNWRLVFAPDWVADYVAAHEAAHLRHADHSPAFWHTVAALHDGVAPARAWLNAHGAGLYRYAPGLG